MIEETISIVLWLILVISFIFFLGERNAGLIFFNSLVCSFTFYAVLKTLNKNIRKEQTK